MRHALPRQLLVGATATVGMFTSLGVRGVVTSAWATPTLMLVAGARPKKRPQPPAPLMLWEGVGAQSSRTSPRGWGWSGPNSSVNILEVSDKERHAGQTTLHWHSEGSGQLSADWNFADPRPAGGTGQVAPLPGVSKRNGIDSRPYHHLTFWLKMKFQPGQAPTTLGVALGAENQRLSPDVDLADALKSASDQGWHLVRLPLALFSSLNPSFAGRKSKSAPLSIDAGALNQIQFTCWSSGQSSFDLFVGAIALDMGTPAKSQAQQVKHS